MAKKGEATATEVVVVEKEDTGIPVVLEKENGAELDTKGLANILKTSVYQHELKVTGEYLKPVEGEVITAMFVGRTKIAGMNGKEVPAVRLLLTDESVKISASAIINSALKDAPIPTPVRIVKTGEKKVPAGILNVFDVWLLS